MRFFRSDRFLYEKRRGDFVVQVLQRDDRRELRFGNHITQSALSTADPDSLILEYSQAMMAVFLLLPNAVSHLHIGLGGGSLPRFIHRHFPKARQTLVELSPEVIEVALRYFYLPVSPRISIIEGEGEEFLKRTRHTFQVIYLDAFTADGVPEHLNSTTFFRSVRERLKSPGWFVNNVWGSDKTTLNLVRDNLRQVFPLLYSISVRWDSNVIFLGAPEANPPLEEPIATVAHRMSRSMPLDFVALASKLARVQEVDGRARITG
jgi:spermidine synthase